MDFDLTWESVSGNEIVSGRVRIMGDNLTDALEEFFSDKGNGDKHLTGVTSVYESPFAQKKGIES